jgi:hypothetical protein
MSSNILTTNLTDTTLILNHIKFLSNNLNPKDKKGNELTQLSYKIEDFEILENLFDALLANNSYKGELEINSTQFNDLIGYKISQLVNNNNISSLKIGNRNHPFSERVSHFIGESLSKNTTLKNFEIFLKTENTSIIFICKFLANPDSNLETFSYLKVNKSLLENINKYLNNNSKLKYLGLYYEPLKDIDLLYGKNMY